MQQKPRDNLFLDNIVLSKGGKRTFEKVNLYL